MRLLGFPEDELQFVLQFVSFPRCHELLAPSFEVLRLPSIAGHRARDALQSARVAKG